MEIVTSFDERGEKALEALRDELRGIRANRAHAGLMEDIAVEYYGAQTPLKHLASVQVKSPRELMVHVWDKGAVASVVKGIEASNLGLSPAVEGQMIRIFLPELSHERREELLKAVKKITEGYRVQIRTLRDESRKEIAAGEKSGELSEDEKRRMEEAVQKATDMFNGEIEEALKKKEVEISE